MNGPEVREVYYNLDGTADWLKSIVRTNYIYWDTGEGDACGWLVTHVSSLAASRAVRFYYSKTDITGGSHG